MGYVNSHPGDDVLACTHSSLQCVPLFQLSSIVTFNAHCRQNCSLHFSLKMTGTQRSFVLWATKVVAHEIIRTAATVSSLILSPQKTIQQTQWRKSCWKAAVKCTKESLCRFKMVQVDEICYPQMEKKSANCVYKSRVLKNGTEKMLDREKM